MTRPPDRPNYRRRTIRIPGLAGIPRRFAYSVAGLGRLFWSAIVGVTALLVATVAIDSRIAIVYFGACAGLWLVLLAALAQFTDTTVRVRSGEFLITYNYGDHVLASDPREECIDLDEVTAVVLTPVDGWTVARVRYEDPLILIIAVIFGMAAKTRLFRLSRSESPDTRRERLAIISITVQGRVFTVPSEQPAVFGETLDRHGIPVETRGAWLRIGTAALSLGVVPSMAAARWPRSVFSGPVLVLLVGILIWIATKPLEA